MILYKIYQPISINRWSLTAAVFLDIHQAVDRVSQDGLIIKLFQLHVPGVLINVIQSYFSGRSKPQPIASGVPSNVCSLFSGHTQPSQGVDCVLIRRRFKYSSLRGGTRMDPCQWGQVGVHLQVQEKKNSCGTSQKRPSSTWGWSSTVDYPGVNRFKHPIKSSRCIHSTQTLFR